MPPVSGSEAAVKALVTLGYTASEADDAVRHALAANGRKDTAEIVKSALGFLARR
jgi:Holliday junction resolvasome RuvABC DNA-binding subunit